MSAVLDQYVGHDVGGNRGTDAGATHEAAEFLVLNDVEEKIASRTAVLGRDRHADESHLARLAPEIRWRALPLLLPADVVRLQLLLEEAPAGLAKQLVLFAEHALERCRRLRGFFRGDLVHSHGLTP